MLASASPRRRELLGALGARFRVSATDAEEQPIFPPPELLAALPPCPLPTATHPTLLAWRKVDAACAELPAGVIIGADTVVVLDGDVLNKPADPDHARAMLRRLSGRTHTVYTGVAVFSRNRPDQPWDIQFDLGESAVTIAELRDDEIAAYVATGEPLDKAGAYGIQGLGGRLVQQVSGSYTNVVGLPLALVPRMLARAGVVGLLDPSEAYRRWLSAQGKEPLPCPPTFP
ncbi:MAG: Maf family protein [Roseiflexaceae bacterium]